MKIEWEKLIKKGKRTSEDLGLVTKKLKNDLSAGGSYRW